MKLLIVDDEKIVRDSIRLIIQREGLTGVDLRAVSTGGAAIETAREFRPDAIFMDIDMPGLNGLEAIQSIREFSPEVIIVIITAYDVFQYAQTAIRYGVYEYLLKPFTPSRIVELLGRVEEKLQNGACLQKRVIQLREEMASMRTAVNHGILNMMITQTGMISALEKDLEGISGQILLLSAAVNGALAGIMTAGNVAEVRQEFQALAWGLRRELSEGGARVDSQMVQEVLRYIEGNLEKNITIESAARQLKTSSGTLGRAMRESLGKSFVTALTEARIQKAISLIQSGAYSMKEICFMVGYNDPNYFSRVFKRVTGENPSAYR